VNDHLDATDNDKVLARRGLLQSGDRGPDPGVVRLRHRQTTHSPAMDRPIPITTEAASSSSREVADGSSAAAIGGPFFPGGDEDERSAYPIRAEHHRAVRVRGDAVPSSEI